MSTLKLIAFIIRQNENVAYASLDTDGKAYAQWTRTIKAYNDMPHQNAYTIINNL